MSFLSSQTNVVLLDARNSRAAFTLPSTLGQLGRIFIVKDAYGAASKSSITLLTVPNDTFEDGATQRVLSNDFANITLFCFSTTRWSVLNATTQYSLNANVFITSTIRNLNLDSYNGLDYPSTQLPASQGKVSFLDGMPVSTTASTVSTYIEFGHLNALPLGASTGAAFRYLVGAERNGTLASGLDFKIKTWTNFSTNEINYGANSSTLRDTFVIDANGTYGVGTAGPSNFLEVVGSVKATTVSTNRLDLNYLTVNCNASSEFFGINGVANFSTLNFVRIRPPQCNLWVAAGEAINNSNATIKYSSNGITWFNAESGGFDIEGRAVAYNGNIWLAGGRATYTAGTIKYSFDGKNWSDSLSGGFTTSCLGLSWNGRMWVAVGSGTNRIKYSFDGSNWSNGSGNVPSAVYAVGWNGSMWVAGGLDLSIGMNRLIYSYNGINWARSISTSGGTFHSSWSLAIKWDGQKWLSGGGAGIGDQTSILTSKDGIEWFSTTTWPFSQQGQSLEWNGRMWLAGGSNNPLNNSTIYQSYDGLSWNPIPGIYSNRANSIVWGGDRFVAAGSNNLSTTSMKYSFDGFNWSNCDGVAFSSVGWSIAYSSNWNPSFSNSNFNILPQSIPLFYNSTNQILALQSTLIFNNTLVVDSGFGNFIGINCNIPRYSLDVAGNVRISTLTVDAGITQTSTLQTFSLAVWGAGGAGLVGSASWTQISDQRLKDQIITADYNRCYNDIKKIPLHRFTYNSSFLEENPLYDTHKLGFLAQEVEPVIPKAIIEQNGVKWLDVDQLRMSLFGAVKRTIYDKERLESTMYQVLRENEEITARISTLEGKFAYKNSGNV